MADFKDLQVWQWSRALVPTLYAATHKFPASERTGLATQIQRAVVSISANIAEGSARHSLRDQARCYRIALASAREVESLVLLAGDLHMVDSRLLEQIVAELNQIQRMLSGLIRSCFQRPTELRR